MALVMVIEDEEALALLLKYNLEKEGFDVVWESSGNRALAAVEKYCPSVILLDWMLPELSGVEICKMIRNKPDIKDIPIIMLTAKGEEEDKIKGLSAGADDYVTKPFSVPELMARVKTNLRRAPELLPHIFDRFFSTRKGGAGIGLSLAKEIVTLHKGTISASNDGGAVFEISLPLRKTI